MEKYAQIFRLFGNTIIVGETANPARPPLLPPELMNAIHSAGGPKPMLLIKKNLGASDVNKDLNRLSVPKTIALMDFLTDKEKGSIENDGGRHDVTVIDPRGCHFVMVFSRWQIFLLVSKQLQTFKNLILTKHWIKLVVENKLKKELAEYFRYKKLWGFRVNGKLFFALNVEGSSSDDNGASSSSTLSLVLSLWISFACSI
ncbi:unnamed protein product [Ilex paraguariensis]|uniref:Uncharacterized protein n=1 Tax=Ilex paraguariensis TaxID=185542 RepID=A0ABC8RC09_9AQUA